MRPSPMHALLLLPFVFQGCARPSRPDVVLVTLDTTRADHLGVYGYERNISPEIDLFARECETFRRAWSTASWTLPAHASLFTGMYPTTHGADYADVEGKTAALSEPDFERQLLASSLPLADSTIAKALSGMGYTTGAFVGGPWLEPRFGLLQGYSFQDAPQANVARQDARTLTDHAIAWLHSISPGQPVHLLLNYFDAHEPCEPPPPFDDLPKTRVPLRVGVTDVNRGQPLPEEQKQAYIDRYDGAIRFMDHHFGRLIATLRETGRLDDALIVVTADHGELFGEHQLMGHGHSLHEPVLRVPFLVHRPRGRNKGHVSDALVSLVDVWPLVAKETGAPLPQAVQGVSLGTRRLVYAESRRGVFFIRHYGPLFDRDVRVLIRWPFKVLEFRPGGVVVYRLDSDPGETRDLGTSSPEPELATALDRLASSLPQALRRAPARLTPEVLESLRALGYVQ